MDTHEGTIAKLLQTVIEERYPELPSKQVVTIAYRLSDGVTDNLKKERDATIAQAEVSDGTTSPTLLSLPAEIRNYIWELAVLNRDRKGYLSPITIETPVFSGRNIKASRHSKAALQPKLSRVCRQVREECLPIFYGLNKFEVELDSFAYDETVNPQDRAKCCIVSRWLQAIGSKNAINLKSVKWSFDAFEATCDLQRWEDEESVALQYADRMVNWAREHELPEKLLVDMESQLRTVALRYSFKDL